MKPEDKAEIILRTYWEGEVPVDVYKIARKMHVQVNEVEFSDDAVGAYCDVTRIIEVKKDLPDKAKRFLVAHYLSKFI